MLVACQKINIPYIWHREFHVYVIRGLKPHICFLSDCIVFKNTGFFTLSVVVLCRNFQMIISDLKGANISVFSFKNTALRDLSFMIVS